MTNERWEEFVETAKQRFEDVELHTEDGDEENVTIDVLTFSMSNQNFKVERENRPVVLDKKQFYSHRQGDTARTEYVLSDSEFSHKIKVYKENTYGDWEEIISSTIGL